MSLTLWFSPFKHVPWVTVLDIRRHFSLLYWWVLDNLHHLAFPPPYSPNSGFELFVGIIPLWLVYSQLHYSVFLNPLFFLFIGSIIILPALRPTVLNPLPSPSNSISISFHCLHLSPNYDHLMPLLQPVPFLSSCNPSRRQHASAFSTAISFSQITSQAFLLNPHQIKLFVIFTKGLYNLVSSSHFQLLYNLSGYEGR